MPKEKAVTERNARKVPEVTWKRKGQKDGSTEEKAEKQKHNENKKRKKGLG